MPREDDALQGIINAYEREIIEAQEQIQQLTREINEKNAHLKALREVRAHRQGVPLAVFAPPAYQPVTSLASEPEDDPSQRGWMKEQLVKWIQSSAPPKFRGADAAKWFKGRFKELKVEFKPYQYNNIFMLLKSMADNGDLVKRVDSHYEKLR